MTHTATNSLESLVSSLFGIAKNILNSIIALFNTILATISTAVFSVVDLAKAFANFIISNLFLMLLIAAGFFGYTLYLQRQRGQPVRLGPVGGHPSEKAGGR